MGEKRRPMWKLFTKLLRVVLENAYLVPPRPSPSLSSCPLLWGAPWAAGASPLDLDTHKALFYLEIERALNFSFLKGDLLCMSGLSD